MKYTRPVLGVSLAAMAGTLAATSAFAQDEGAQESGSGGIIIVTAQRREEAQVDVPISITTLGPAALETANVQEISDIGTVTPALRFDRQNQFVQPTIRGIGTSITTSGGGSNVGIYVDGFYSPNPAEADFDLMNVDSVQVLKGPQGTLFGRNTTGGAILVTTADPSEEDHGSARISYGRFNKLRMQAYATGGLAEGLAVDIEGLYSRGDLFQRNITTGERDREYENWSVRLGAKAWLSDNLTAKLRYQHSESDDPRSVVLNIYNDPVLGDGAPNFAPPVTYTTDPDFYFPGADTSFLRSDTDIVQLTLEADLGWADLTSYTQYRHQGLDASLDLDKTAITIFQLGLPVINNTWTQELLLTSKPGTALQYTAGLFYFYNSDRYFTFLDNNVSVGGPRVRLGGSEAPTRSYAAFVDATYEFSPQFFITAGVRYSHDTITNAYWNAGTTVMPVDDIKNDKITPRLVLRYKPTDSSSVYASYTKGYKAAIADVGGSCQVAPFVCNDVGPENVDAFEVGFKYNDNGIAFETAAFYYDYRGLQVSLFTNGQAAIINAAKSEIYGLEGSFSYDAGNGFSVNAGAAYVHGRYTDFPEAPVYTRCPDPAGCGFGTSFFIVPTPLKNVDMQRVPEFTGNIGARYEAMVGGGELALSGNLYYTSSFFFGPSGIQFPGGDYEVLSLRAQWTDPSDSWHIAVFGDNVTDSRYVNQVQYNNFGIGSTWSEPATWGVEFGVNF